MSEEVKVIGLGRRHIYVDKIKNCVELYGLASKRNGLHIVKVSTIDMSVKLIDRHCQIQQIDFDDDNY